jgi:L-ascorbate metabolism protein UlaG (beta-lactamase superfamily)
MRIRWYGQSAFLISGSHRVAIDPFGPMGELAASRGIVFDYPAIDGLEADVLLITHEHADHNAADVVGGQPAVIRSTAGTIESPLGDVLAIASEHDDVAGTRRGPNTIFCFELDDVRFCHFGDFGQAALRSEQRAAIGEVDVLFLPVGGSATIGGDVAAAVVHELQPRLVVPMHYRTAAVNFLDPPDAFLAAVDGTVEQLDSSDFEVESPIGSGGSPVIVFLAPPARG